MWILITVFLMLHLHLVINLLPSIKEVKNGEFESSIHNCCSLARSSVCRSTCILSIKTTSLNETCRRSDEPELFSCLENYYIANKCCAHLQNPTCQSICKDIFYMSNNASIVKFYNNQVNCFNQIPKCLKSLLGTGKIENPAKYTDCCEKANNRECLESCRAVIQTANSEKEILDALEVKCSPVKPQSPMWSCLLKLVPTELNRLPLDVGKLSCCAKASTPACENQCRRTYYSDWQLSWSNFENECLSSLRESELRICLEDADSTCKFGCTGLSFCTIFNNDFITPFRSCTTNADKSAKREFENWINGEIVHSLGVPVRTASQCPKETLHTLACILHLQPCESGTHETSLCYNDCLELMTNCVDWSTVSKSYSAESLCLKFSLSATNQCISLKSFTTNSYDLKKTTSVNADVQIRCKNKTCSSNEKCLGSSNILDKDVCQPNCTLGKMSKQVVTGGSWIQIPRFERQGCYKICQCTLNGIEKCKILNCFTFKSCWVQDRFISHNTAFFLECNKCRCFMGEITCFKKNCGENRTPMLPCDCPVHYVPTCSRLGITFASSCLAKCAGFMSNEIEFGSCSSKDPCIPNPCNGNEKCIRKSRVCLSSIYKPCRQYECISLNCTSDVKVSNPVCDEDNEQHESLCNMIKVGKSLGYRGPCLQNCDLKKKVCGINGEIYPNECAAIADKTIVDYFGSCVTVGLINDQAKPHCTDTVTCPELVIPNCIGVTPPGACCPVCGGAARIYYSKKQLDRVLYMMEEEKDKDAVTLQSMLTSLERQISFKECSLRGMVTLDGDIFIIIIPDAQVPSTDLLQMCLLEIERLSILILQRSPTIMVEVPLSALTGAEIVHTQVSSTASTTEFSIFILILFIFDTMFVHFKYI